MLGFPRPVPITQLGTSIRLATSPHLLLPCGPPHTQALNGRVPLTSQMSSWVRSTLHVASIWSMQKTHI